MKRNIANGLITVGLVILVGGLVFYVNPVNTDQNETWYVEAFGQRTATTNLDKGHREEGYFTVRGGNEELAFWIKDPFGATIYNARDVRSRRDFAFTAEYSGAYTLYFENNEAVAKTIYFTMKSDAAPIGIVIALIGVVIMATGLASIARDWARAKQSEIQRTK